MTADRRTEPRARVRVSSSRREALGVVGVWLVLLGVLAYRATLGLSLYDDTHYVTVALRIASGARPFVDEMTIQSLGFLVPAAFIWLWTRFASLAGVVLATRVFYLVLASATVPVLYLALRRAARPAVAGIAAAAAVMCPPFNLFAPSYNTVALLALALAFALSYVAWREGGRLAPACAGAAMVVAAVSYVPLTFASAALLVTLLVASRDRKVVVWAAVGGLVAACVLLGWLVPHVSITDIQRMLAYASANVLSFGSPLHKLLKSGSLLVGTLTSPMLIPAWVLAIVACVPQLPKGVRAWSLLLLPIAAAASDVAWMVGVPGAPTMGHVAALLIVKFTIIAAAPAAVLAQEAHRRDVLRLLAFALPCSLVGVAVVLYSTNAGTVAATYVAGMVPLVMAVVVGWADAAIRIRGDRARVSVWVALLVPTLLLLFASAFSDGRPSTLHATISSGPYAGIHTTEARRNELAALEAAGRRHVKPTDRVTFLGERSAYLLVGGRAYTNAVWLYPGPSSSAALEYFGRHGGMPDVVFVDDLALAKLGKRTYASAAPTDPLLKRVLAEYRQVDEVASFGVFARR